MLAELLRYRTALRFYADKGNYLDGVPMMDNFAVEDEGHTAQTALRVLDYIGEPKVVLGGGEIVGNETNGSQAA